LSRCLRLNGVQFVAEYTERGANLDQIDFPLNNGPFLLQQFGAIRNMSGEPARLAALASLVAWADPGPGGFYDDVGVPAAAPHVLPGAGWRADPQLFRTAWNAFSVLNSQSYEPRQPPPSFPCIPRTWLTYARSMYDQPLQLRYAGLDAAGAYAVTIVYASGQVGAGSGPITLLANGMQVRNREQGTPNVVSPSADGRGNLYCLLCSFRCMGLWCRQTR
jgi:hypothetical protein